MKRRFRTRFALPAAWFGAAAVLLTGAAWLRAQAPAQTQAAQTRETAQTEPARVQPAPHTQPVRAGAAAPTQPAPSDNAPANEASPLNAWDLYRRGGYFMYPLTFCSVLAVALIIERFLALRREGVIPRAFLPGLRKAAPDLLQNRNEALAFCRAMDSSIARMLAAGIKRLPRGALAAEKAIEDAGANEALKLRRNMRFLYSLGSVATLLGLIGTIAGMIVAFHAFRNAAASGAGDVHELSTGIYEAMVNTFGGLAVAIVVTTFYYYFISRIERLVSELNDTLAQFSDEFDFDKAEIE